MDRHLKALATAALLAVSACGEPPAPAPATPLDRPDMQVVQVSLVQEDAGYVGDPEWAVFHLRWVVHNRTGRVARWEEVPWAILVTPDGDPVMSDRKLYAMPGAREMQDAVPIDMKPGAKMEGMDVFSYPRAALAKGKPTVRWWAAQQIEPSAPSEVS